MRIHQWTNRADKDAGFKELAPKPTDTSNWITVLIGRNGTKKSLLLRLIIEGVLPKKKQGFRINSHAAIMPALALHGNPQSTRVIAISGTPFDRFPRQNGWGDKARKSGSGGVDNYVYLGQKAANGSMGTTQSIRMLAYLLFKASKAKSQTAAGRCVFNFLGLRPLISVQFRRHTSLNVANAETSVMERIVTGGASREKIERKLQSLATTDVRDRFGTDELYDLLTRLPARVEFNFNKPSISVTNEKELEFNDLLLLIEAGFIVPAHALMRWSAPGADERILLESDLSSGQWQLLSSMLGLALSVEKDSLVLIDEPENSLHPEWQRSYVDILMDVMSHKTGCHAIIATHSPLVASGVKAGAGNVQQLSKQADGPLGIDTQPVDVSYGWEAGDVYEEVFGLESTRAPSFVEKADRALDLIANGQSEIDKLKPLAEELIIFAENLPKGDSMRSVIHAIAKVAEKG